tara:strand:+ start:31 stop:252 length:222 start_codon:yes stop_codon:yes gene_type:complete
MKLSFPHVDYPSLINPDVCKKIINLGISKIEKNNDELLDTTGTTQNQKEKSNINFRYLENKKSFIFKLLIKSL